MIGIPIGIYIHNKVLIYFYLIPVNIQYIVRAYNYYGISYLTLKLPYLTYNSILVVYKFSLCNSR